MLGFFADNLPSFLMSAFSFIAVLTVIVFIHELGHFLVGRWCGVKVDVFSIGFGREIFGWNDKHGTRWKLAWLPLGGYVKFAGDANAASMPDPDAPVEDGSFHSKSLWQRSAVVAAGPFANFILAIVLFAGIYSIVGKPMIQPVVSEVIKASAAEKAGFAEGDKIIVVDGHAITSFSDIPVLIANKYDVEIPIIVERDGRKVELKVTPTAKVVKDGMGGKVKVGLLGIKASLQAGGIYQRKNIGEALLLGTQETWSIITRSLDYMHGMVTQRVSTDQLAGPVGIAQLTGNVAKVSFVALVELMALLSVSIGLINLFPVPMLDGGHLLFYAIEAIRGKALSQKAQEFGFMVGFALVLSLMLFATRNDLFVRLNLFGN